MIINIVAGGPEELIPELNRENGDIWVGVDRGTLHLIQHNIKPEVAFGDFDSISEQELEEINDMGIKLNTFQSEKDDTDIELAIKWSIKEEPNEICLYGATGGRLDHAFINVQLLIKGLAANIPITLIDRQNKILLCKPGEYTAQRDPDFTYISFLSVFESVEGLTLKDFKYELVNTKLNYGSSLCISNELDKNFGTYFFTKGILMMVRSRDRFLG